MNEDRLSEGDLLRTEDLGRLREEAARLQSEWEKRFTPEAFRNPLFAEAYLVAVKKRDGLRHFQALGLSATLPEGNVPISLFEVLRLALDRASQEEVRDRLARTLEATLALLGLGQELLEDPLLSRFRNDVLGVFPIDVPTPPLTAMLAPTNRPRPSKLPGPIELESFVGKVFRGYKVREALGRGGFGAVFLAEHPTLPIKHALKIFLDVDRSGPGFLKFREKCFAEARLQARLKHENILEVIDAFEDQGYVILVMEYVDGPNLAQVIDEKNREGGHFEPSQVLGLAIPIARGLAHAHRHGIAHRDMKPENILLHGDGPKIADFGLARHIEESGQRHTTAGFLVGTPAYMAPEQIAAKPKSYDHRCDVYSFGVVLYQLCLGLVPFEDENRFKILEMHQTEAPEPLSLKIKDFPEELDRIILTCLKKRPEDRFQSADELLAALEECQKNLARGIKETPRQPWEGRGTARRRKALITLGSLLLLTLAAIAGVPLFPRWQKAGEPGSRLADRKGDAAPASVEHRENPEKEPERSASIPPPKKEASTLPAADRKEPELSARERADAKVDITPSKIREIPPPALPLREQLARYPMSADDIVFLSRLQDVFASHRSELALRRYDEIQKDLGALAPPVKTEHTAAHIEAALDLVRLSSDLVQGRWKEWGETKGQIRLSLEGGGVAEGAVDHADDRAITLTDAQGGKTDILLAKIASEALLQGKTIPVALVAYQALSGDATKALDLAQKLEKENEKIAVWFPVLVRLARLRASELVKTAMLEAEAPLSKKEKKDIILKRLPHYLPAVAALRSLSDVAAEVSGIYPPLEREFKQARQEGEAMELLLDGAASRVLSNFEGTEAYPIAATFVLASFMGEIEGAHNDLMGDAGWLKYNWELRPLEEKLEDSLQFFDRLSGEGCFIRDPKGPRSLIMGRPHPRTAEGLVIVYQFEPLGEGRENSDWRLNLRRDGGGNTYLRFAPGSISLRTFSLDSAALPEILGSVAVPRDPAQARFHTCVLIPGEKLHLYLDGRIVANLTKEDTILPSQLSLAVSHGKLSVQSIWAKKKPAK
jgi:serine/threonine-protein kinase